MDKENQPPEKTTVITSYNPDDPDRRFYTVVDLSKPCQHYYVPASKDDCLFYQCTICKNIKGN